jgi:hypothetical protein
LLFPFEQPFQGFGRWIVKILMVSSLRKETYFISSQLHRRRPFVNSHVHTVTGIGSRLCIDACMTCCARTDFDGVDPLLLINAPVLPLDAMSRITLISLHIAFFSCIYSESTPKQSPWCQPPPLAAQNSKMSTFL